MPALQWTIPKPLSTKLSVAVLAELLDGGQSFRWTKSDDGQSWTGVWADNVAKLSIRKDDQLQWIAPVAIAGRVEKALRNYLPDDNQLQEQLDRLPWRSDEHLAKCLHSFSGLRILQQPFGETLLCFLCSATKQIVQIKQMTALLADCRGAEIVPGFRRLPTWDELARANEASLRECKLGFRAKYISETARFLAKNPGWLEATASAPYAEAKARLCTLPGVGEKVADCVLLFGAGRLEAFPVDVWILRTMALRYGLESWKPSQVAHFGRVHFGNLAGLAQQYLFAYERRFSRNRED
ncbi:MAG: DNA glycosylase [Nibricoccus sp.]